MHRFFHFLFFFLSMCVWVSECRFGRTSFLPQDVFCDKEKFNNENQAKCFIVPEITGRTCLVWAYIVLTLFDYKLKIKIMDLIVVGRTFLCTVIQSEREMSVSLFWCSQHFFLPKNKLAHDENPVFCLYKFWIKMQLKLLWNSKVSYSPWYPE